MAKRILHVAKRYWPFVGGQERYVLDLAREQVRRGHQCLVVTPNRDLVAGQPGILPRRARMDGVEILRLSVLGGPAKQVIAELPLDLLRAIRWADVVHHHDPRFAFETTLIAAAMLRRPVIVHSHGLFFHTPRAARLKRLLTRYYYGPVFRRVATVVAGSREDERSLADLAGLGADRIAAIPSGIDLRRVALAAHAPEGALIFMFGRLAEHKGHVSVLEALALVDAPWRLAVAGRGEDSLAAALRERAAALGIADRVEWLGEIPDSAVLNWTSRARLLLFPSRFEGFGLALVEALAGGAIVLASRIPAHEAILTGTELQECLIDFDAPRAAATRIAAALALPQRRLQPLRDAAIARAADFSIERVADDVELLYERLLTP